MPQGSNNYVDKFVDNFGRQINERENVHFMFIDVITVSSKNG